MFGGPWLGTAAALFVGWRGYDHSSFEDLRVWQESMDLAVAIYQATSSFPKHETYGLSSQMRRAAVSVPSNIAEGKGHRSDPEFVRFLFHAREDRSWNSGRSC